MARDLNRAIMGNSALRGAYLEATGGRRSSAATRAAPAATQDRIFASLLASTDGLISRMLQTRSTKTPSIPEKPIVAVNNRPTRLSFGGGPSISSPRSQFDWGGAISDIGGAIVEGAGNWVVDQLSGSGSEGTSGSPAIPGGTSLVPGGSPCGPGRIKNPITGGCINLPGGPVTGGGMFHGVGEAVHGQYGVALQPAMMQQTRLRCPRGMVLGMDELCYNRRDLRKDERKWVPPRKPLLTGGDLNAISRAARAASRMKVQQKRLEKLGLLKKPSRGRPAPRRGISGKGITVIDTE